ncbi:hypothetical protein LUQ84_002010 [Hamiltosporidium tvaerminnensis]|nr:hypothetical protein LUQ84_002010 [Hamiltosporidium tvaerminnensis]
MKVNFFWLVFGSKCLCAELTAMKQAYSQSIKSDKIKFGECINDIVHNSIIKQKEAYISCENKKYFVFYDIKQENSELLKDIITVINNQNTPFYCSSLKYNPKEIFGPRKIIESHYNFLNSSNYFKEKTDISSCDDNVCHIFDKKGMCLYRRVKDRIGKTFKVFGEFTLTGSRLKYIASKIEKSFSKSDHMEYRNDDCYIATFSNEKLSNLDISIISNLLQEIYGQNNQVLNNVIIYIPDFLKTDINQYEEHLTSQGIEFNTLLFKYKIKGHVSMLSSDSLRTLKHFKSYNINYNSMISILLESFQLLPINQSKDGCVDRFFRYLKGKRVYFDGYQTRDLVNMKVKNEEFVSLNSLFYEFRYERYFTDDEMEQNLLRTYEIYRLYYKNKLNDCTFEYFVVYDGRGLLKYVASDIFQFLKVYKRCDTRNIDFYMILKTLEKYFLNENSMNDYNNIYRLHTLGTEEPIFISEDHIFETSINITENTIPFNEKLNLLFDKLKTEIVKYFEGISKSAIKYYNYKETTHDFDDTIPLIYFDGRIDSSEMFDDLENYYRGKYSNGSTIQYALERTFIEGKKRVKSLQDIESMEYSINNEIFLIIDIEEDLYIAKNEISLVLLFDEYNSCLRISVANSSLYNITHLLNLTKIIKKIAKESRKIY